MASRSRRLEPYTKFTGELLRILAHGIPRGPEVLTMEAIYEELRLAMREGDWPEPHRRVSGDARQLGLALNPAVPRSRAVQIGPETGRPPRWIVPGLAGDIDSTQDMLGIRLDSTAIAVLLCSANLKPPLALGIYGDWGSGKTFFMQMLERGDQENSRPARWMELCRNVASVWFNAWHYSEGNLWASLIHQIFTSLHGEGSAAEQRLEAAMSNMQAVLEAKRGAQSVAEKALADADAAKARLATLESQYERAKATASEATVADLWAVIKVDPDAQRQLGEAREILGMQAVGNSARELADAAAEVRDIAERGWVLATAGRWWKTPVALGSAAALAIGAIGVGVGLLADASTTWLAPLIARITWFAALIGGAAVWLGRQASLGRQLLRPAEAIQREVNNRLTQLAQEHEEKRKEAERQLQEAERRRDVALLEVERAQLRVADARTDLSQLRGARLLERFLSERVNESDDGQYLGVVALAHRDLKDLSSFFATAAKTADGAEPVDRILLYVDDLDRCSPRR